MPRAKTVTAEDAEYSDLGTALTVVPDKAVDLIQNQGLDAEQLDLLKRTICKGADDLEFKLFVNVCNLSNLNPFARQVFAVQRWDSKLGRNVMSIQISVDGLRVIAQRSHEYQGQEGPFWAGRDGVWTDLWIPKANEEFPFAAKVGVMRRGFIKPIYSIAKWDSYAVTGKNNALTPMWEKMPDLMLAKAAESLALRRAFPAEVNGIYSTEEMAQANTEIIEIKPVEVEDYRTLTRLSKSSEGRAAFMAEATKLGADGKFLCELYKVGSLAELPNDVTYGEFLDKIKEAKGL